MSLVSNVVVHVVDANDAVCALLEGDLGRLHSASGGLRHLDYRMMGGSKAFEDDVYTGAFNHLDVEGFFEWWEGLPWKKDDVACVSVSTEAALHAVRVQP